MKLLSLALLMSLTACGVDKVEVNCNDVSCVTVENPKTDTPVPAPAPAPKEVPPTTEVDKIPDDGPVIDTKYYARVTYIVQDEEIDKVACTTDSRGLKMEYQFRKVTLAKFESLSTRDGCEVTREPGSDGIRDGQVSCEPLDNFIYLSDTCDSGQVIKYKHFYRPNLASWGPTGTPIEAEFQPTGQTSK